LHFIRAAVSLVNGGYVVEPTILKKQQDPEQQYLRVISEETSKLMRKLMRLTVLYGSGKKADANGYLVGGKTGSAEKSQKGGYSKTAKYSSFFAAFPVNNPRYVTLMILDDPRPNAANPYTGGGWTSAPLTSNIITRIAPILNVKPVDHDDPEIQEELYLEYDPEAEIDEELF
jgi:cell division protein FtsI (penicillin-binding protein 3)